MSAFVGMTIGTWDCRNSVSSNAIAQFDGRGDVVQMLHAFARAAHVNGAVVQQTPQNALRHDDVSTLPMFISAVCLRMKPRL